MTPSVDPLNIVLEFARAEQGGDPYAFRFAPQDYLLRSEGGAFGNTRLEWGEGFLTDLAAIRKPGREPDVVQRLGDSLRRFLAPTKWGRDEDRLLDAVKDQRRVLITIRSAAAELYALPWELLTIQSTGQHIGELPGVLLRYEWPDTHSISDARTATAERPGRILVAWSAAAGAVPAAEHIAAIRAAAQAGAQPFDLERDVLANASAGRLSRVLAAATQDKRPVAVLHLLCHGAAAGNTFGLAFDGEDAAEAKAVVDAARLRQLLAPHAATLRLIVLSACDSGNSGELGNHVGSVAQALHRAGFAAVVASRYPLSVAGSIRLCESLYDGLLPARKPLAEALLDARLRLAADTAQLDWASLQLYARSADDVARAPAPTPVPAALVATPGPAAPATVATAPRKPLHLYLAALMVVMLALGYVGLRFIRANQAPPKPTAPNIAASPTAPPTAPGRSLDVGSDNDITGEDGTKVRTGMVGDTKLPPPGPGPGPSTVRIGSGNKIKVGKGSTVEAGAISR